jgi:uncharacterized membrane protein YdjX (TVP38/TMEM64 family)
MSTRFWKRLLGSVWVLGLLVILITWRQSGIGLRETPHLLEELLRQFGLYRAALCYIVLYALRPLIFFPATLLTIASGLLFGPWLGILFTIIGENASANFAFLLARWFGRDWIDKHESPQLQQWELRLSNSGLLTVLIMRLLMLPFDAVNYGCGLTAMRQRDFAIGTFIGIMPALISFVLLGGIGAAGVENRLLLLVISLFFLFLGLLVAKRLKRREAGLPAQV